MWCATVIVLGLVTLAAPAAAASPDEAADAVTLFFEANYQGASAQVPCCNKRAFFDRGRLMGGSARVGAGVVLILHTEPRPQTNAGEGTHTEAGTCTASGAGCKANPTVRLHGDAADLRWYTDQPVTYAEVRAEAGLAGVAAESYVERGCAGAAMPLRVGDHDHDAISNDAIRSFRVPPGLLLTYKEHAAGYPGRAGTCGAAPACCELQGWADRAVSSVRVQVLPGTALHARLYPVGGGGDGGTAPPPTDQQQAAPVFSGHALQTGGGAMTGCVTAGAAPAAGARVRVQSCSSSPAAAAASGQRWTTTGCGQMQLTDSPFCLGATLTGHLPTPITLGSCDCSDYAQRE